MQIDWFEIIAMIINFFLMLFILQKLLYKPVINAMATRQERIQKAQIEASEKMDRAKVLINEYDKKIVNIDKEKREILDDARREALEKKDSLLIEYQEEADNKRRAYLKEIEDEKELFLSNLRNNLGKNAVKIASRILDTISSKDLEDEVFHTFIGNLQNLKKNIPDKDILKEENYLDLYSSRSLSDNEKKNIQDVLNSQMEDLKEISYKVDENLVLGYELNLETYTIHTNIRNYLEEIEKDIIKNLETN